MSVHNLLYLTMPSNEDPETGGCSPSCPSVLDEVLTQDFWLQKKVWVPVSVVLFIGVILTIALVPASFSYVEYDELALKKNTVSNKVDNSIVYENGRYFWGVSVEPLTFPSKYQLISNPSEYSFLTSGKPLLLYLRPHLRYKAPTSALWLLLLLYRSLLGYIQD